MFDNVLIIPRFQSFNMELFSNESLALAIYIFEHDQIFADK